MKFPSLEWFQQLQRVMRDNSERFRRLGFCDAVVGVKIEPGDGFRETRAFGLNFEGYDCKEVREAGSAEELQADFILEGRFDTWKEMIENVRHHRGPDLDHTLNRLVLAGSPLRLVAADQLRADLFYRYNQTFQEFFNGAAQVPTEFAG